MSAAFSRRRGFSLMEMMIATAVLAGSGVALFALVGQASQLARKAEERTVALQMAQSTLDEFLAGGGQSEEQTTGDFQSDPRWTYRIEQSEVETVEQSEARLKRIVVSIYRSGDTNDSGASSTDSAVVSLVRWSRAAPSAQALPTQSTLPEEAVAEELGPP